MNYTVDWVAVGAIVTGFGTLLLGVSALVASQAWRGETIVRRKVELAEEGLNLVYQAKDKIAFARNGFAFPGEGEFEHEEINDDLRSHAYAMNVPAKRLLDDGEFFGDINSIKYPLQAHYGVDVRQAIDDILHIRHRLIVASQARDRAVINRYEDMPNQRDHI